ncbi:hypothetical protein [Empedobacter brevis]|uniref:hypothetical protein n=1 Tax=Empedobacter brevis TaxID=247 RepID=UPI0039AFA060
MQGLAGYVDYHMKMEQKDKNDSSNKDKKALFSQTSTEEENNQKNSSNEIVKKIHYFHEIKLFTFFNVKQTTHSDYHQFKRYSSFDNGVTTPPPEII